MVLVDTSTWIKGLAGDASFMDELNGLLADEQVAAHEMVYGELLIGDRGGRKRFLALYGQIELTATVPHHEVAQFVVDRSLHGRGVGWVDVHLLASAIVGRLRLWTLDPRLATVAKEFGVAYEGSAQASKTFSQ